MRGHVTRFSYIALAILIAGFAQGDRVNAEESADDHLQIMMEAARKLRFDYNPDNRAYLLVKQETVRAPVGVIFGYADNAAACDEIAEVLSNSLRVGTFKCGPIY